MGSWGIKALQSDEGLYLIEVLEDLYENKSHLILSDIISKLIKRGSLPENKNEIEYLYDCITMALAELVIMYFESGDFYFSDDTEKHLYLENKTIFDTDYDSINFLYIRLLDIINNEISEDGERESYELWSEKKIIYLKKIIEKLEKLKSN